jgi:N-glycosylase/DNA lyase
MVLSLCKQFSPPLLELPDPNDHKILHTYHPFPTPSSLATEGVSTTLRTLGFGYRAEYVHRTAKMLVESHGAHIPAGQTIESAEVWLRGLRSLNTNVARDELLKFFGVGRKVADCVLLMSLDKVKMSHYRQAII